MEKLWLKSYPTSVSHEIDFNLYSSLPAMIEEACQIYAKQVAFSNMGVTLRFEEVWKLSQDFASYLQNELGLKKGDRLAIQMPNCLQYPIVLFGSLLAGVVVVNTNPLYTPQEMEHQFKDSGAKAIVLLANFASKLEEILPKTSIQHVIVSELGDFFPGAKRVLTNLVVKYVKKMVPSFHLKHVPLRKALALGAQKPFMKVAISQEDLAFLQYTGGTTGVSKGAMLTQKNMVSNVLQMNEWMKPSLTDGQEVILAALPLYHIFSLTVNCIGLFKRGMKNILITNPRDIPALVKEIDRQKPTVMTLVNTLAGGMLENTQFRALDFKNLKVSVAGGMALKSAVANRWLEVTHTPIVEGYGLTETSPVATCNPLNKQSHVGSIGLPVPSTELKLINEAGKEVALGETGEICVKGPQVMRGYYNQPNETAQVLGADGWLKTGDMGQVNAQGYFQIVDRKKDMILVSGFNVYPNEVEEVIAKHPKVLEVAVIGAEDPHSGEVVKAIVVPRDLSLTEEEVREFAKKELTSYKVPKHVEFRKELPKNNVGKVLRRLLR